MLNTETAKVGDSVGVLGGGSFWHTFTEGGLHTIVKKDKVKIVVKRDSDGHERKFNLRGYEAGDKYRRSYLVSEQEYQDTLDELSRARVIRSAWSDLENAVNRKYIPDIESFVGALKQLLK